MLSLICFIDRRVNQSKTELKHEKEMTFSNLTTESIFIIVTNAIIYPKKLNLSIVK